MPMPAATRRSFTTRRRVLIFMEALSLNIILNISYDQKKEP
jgi:hypothetical protein